MTWRLIPSFERLPISVILERNPERADEMARALVHAATAAVWNGADRLTRIELMREAIRPFDRFAHQRGEALQ